MRKVQRWAVLAFVAMLLAGVYHLTHWPDAPIEDVSSAALGMMLLEKENRLYVLAVTKGSAAERAGVLPGDYLLRLEDEMLGGMSELEALMEDAQEPMELLIRREGQEIFIQLPVK